MGVPRLHTELQGGSFESKDESEIIHFTNRMWAKAGFSVLNHDIFVAKFGLDS